MRRELVEGSGEFIGMNRHEEDSWVDFDLCGLVFPEFGDCLCSVILIEELGLVLGMTELHVTEAAVHLNNHVSRLWDDGLVVVDRRGVDEPVSLVVEREKKDIATTDEDFKPNRVDRVIDGVVDVIEFFGVGISRLHVLDSIEVSNLDLIESELGR